MEQCSSPPEFIPGLRVAYLARISKLGKDENNRDREMAEHLAAQDNKVLEFIKEKGLILDDAYHYREVGSAYSRPINSRPELQRILSDAQQGKWTALCIYKIDRLDRNDEIRAMAFIRELLEANVWVYAYEDNMWLDMTTRMARFILFYKLSMAGTESENMSIRIKAKFAQKLKEAKGDKAIAKLGGIPRDVIPPEVINEIISLTQRGYTMLYIMEHLKIPERWVKRVRSGERFSPPAPPPEPVL